MKKLFGQHKPKPAKVTPITRELATGTTESIPTPIHQQLATYGQISTPSLHPAPQTIRKPSNDEERWEVVSNYDDKAPLQRPPPLAPSRASSYTSLPPGASPPIPSPMAPRSPSPYHTVSNTSIPVGKLPSTRDRDRDRDSQVLQQATNRKKPPPPGGAVGILRALDPPRAEMPIIQTRSHSEDRYTQSESGHRERERDREEKKEKKGFWGTRDNKERERERDRDMGRDRDRRDEESQAELTRMIGYLTATASEDWALVLEVCERASSSESNAKEAVRALRREFKYGEPPAQLSAARLWAIMLRNSSELFISQSTTRKFLDTLEDLLTTPKTSPVVRERLLNVVAAAAYASGNKKDPKADRDGFRGLWRKVKPLDKPDEGIPLDNDDAMFSPPVNTGRLSQYDNQPAIYQDSIPVAAEFVPPTPPPVSAPPHHHRKRKSPTRNRIIPPEEDIRRLFQECKIGQGNASLLSQALALSEPEDLKKQDIIKEFYAKCRASQELIYAQIPWASAGAERSRLSKEQEGYQRKRTYSHDSNLVLNTVSGNESPVAVTVEEELLAALLAANAELIEALQQYEDLERVAMERKAELRSRKDTRMDRRQLQYLEQDQLQHGESAVGSHGGSSSSRSPSPSYDSHSPPSSILAHPRPHRHSELYSSPDLSGQQTLAPPPAAPHGPRSPSHTSGHSRTPSPATPILESSGMSSSILNGFGRPNGLNNPYAQHDPRRSMGYQEDDEFGATPLKPSAKALGKRKVIEPEMSEGPAEADDIFFNGKDDAFLPDDPPDSDSDDSQGGKRPQVRYVYDAAAERTEQRLREGQAQQLVNGT